MTAKTKIELQDERSKLISTHTQIIVNAILDSGGTISGSVITGEPLECLLSMFDYNEIALNVFDATGYEISHFRNGQNYTWAIR